MATKRLSTFHSLLTNGPRLSFSSSFFFLPLSPILCSCQATRGKRGDGAAGDDADDGGGRGRQRRLRRVTAQLAKVEAGDAVEAVAKALSRPAVAPSLPRRTRRPTTTALCRQIEDGSVGVQIRTRRSRYEEREVTVWTTAKVADGGGGCGG
uniref:Uncharacterized protein n=1 Tax=Oryza meridionalis TaxID=40149 RepID=A0A0E0C0F7_9ORYZ